MSACTLTTSLDGFSNGTNETPNDAGAAIPDASADRAGDADGVRPDGASPPTDDAGAMTEFCAVQSPSPFFCMDFKGVSGPPSGWTNNVNPSNLGGTQVISTPVRSPPSALRAWITPASELRRAYWARPFDMTVTHVRFTYSMLVEERPMTNEVELNFLRIDSGTAQSYFYLALAPNKAEYWEQRNETSGETANPISGTLPIVVGQWVRIGFEVVLTGAPTAVISIDGVERVRRALTQPTSAGKPILTAGVTWSNSNTDRAKVVLDDITFEILP